MVRMHMRFYAHEMLVIVVTLLPPKSISAGRSAAEFAKMLLLPLGLTAHLGAGHAVSAPCCALHRPRLVTVVTESAKHSF